MGAAVHRRPQDVPAEERLEADREAYESNPVNPPAYLFQPSGSLSADVINSRYFAREFTLPVFDPLVVDGPPVVSGCEGEEDEWNAQVESSRETREWVEWMYDRATAPD